MIKSQLIEAIAHKMPDLEMEQVAKSVKLLLRYVTDSIYQGERVEIRDFGNFSLNYHPPRNAHNPRNGQRLVTEGRYHLRFKPGKALREKIDESAQKGIPISDPIAGTDEDED